MIKKIIISICICFSCCLLFEKNVNAQEFFYEEVVEILDVNQISRYTKTTTGKKTASIKNSSGKVLWYVSVTGTFTYTGSKATCTKSVVEAEAKDSRWKILSKSSSKTSNKASATAIAGDYLDGTLIAKQTKTVTLTCSPSGKLS